uniref:Bromo domain-containing protein n=1 Tax=Myripristis murdjan TaxID=586833 RepID=A0A667YGI3_9TELE
MTNQTTAACSHKLFHNQDLTVDEPASGPQQPNVIAVGDHLALSNDGMSEFSNSDLSLPEVCISTNNTSFEDDMNYEVQQAYRIFTGFLLDKYKGITSPFLHPIGHLEAQHGIGGVRGWGQAQLRQSMCLRRMEEKFVNQEYETITEFVADFRLMLENCYRYHGVDHWISKQAQKLEIMLEQKLTLLSRALREKTTLAVTSKGRFGAEEERGSGGTSTRRRLAPRSLATITVGGHESIMVQTLRLEEQQRAKEEKRQRELEKKEAEEMSAKEVEEWEQNLLSQATPHPVDTLWELPAIGHFLCLAQTALNLPEIVFFELERCLLMPRSSVFLSKIMSSLLSPPQRRATLNRRPALPYCRWELELRQRVLGWYRAVGVSRDQPGRAEQFGLCYQFFSILGEVSPLEETPFHLLPFYQRVWLLKGLCDNVYETQKDVQDAVLAQPIHECRESILGYDSMENAYIHFPHFCGADLRIYCQSPSTPPAFPFPPVWVKRIEIDGCYGVSMETGESEDWEKERAERHGVFKRENGDRQGENEVFNSWSLQDEEDSNSGSSDEGDSSEDCKSNLKIHTNSSSLSHLESSIGGSGGKIDLKEETANMEHQSKRLTLKQEPRFSLDSGRTIKKIRTKKKRRKKKREREQLLGAKGEHRQLRRVDRTRPCQAQAAKSSVGRLAATIKRKDKRKKHKTGEKTFSLVCTSLEELRELISKTEDELDDLESTKKRSGRWYFRREAVKDLHITLIRLLNELSPWEPKLVKAYQRNRLRLKKECDDFKKHPDYNNFVREECVSSSSDDDEERVVGKEACSLLDHYRRAEEEDPEYTVPRGLWTGGKLIQLVTHDLSLLSRSQTGGDSVTSTPDSGLDSRPELHQTNQSRDSKSAWAAAAPAQASLGSKPIILHPTIGLPKGYTPIPTLLAKSVGNKVTLMKRPADYVGQPVIASVTAPSKPPQAKPIQTAPKSPVQVVYKVPEGLGHLLRKDSSSSVQISVQPVVGQKTGDKIMQQVVILPSNLLVQKTEEKMSSQNQQPKGIQAPVSKVSGPLCMSTNVPGFTIPDNRIPVQQVAPLNDARTVRTPSPSVSPHLQQGPLNTAGFKGAQVGSPKANTSQSSVMPNHLPITIPTSAVSTDHVKSKDPKQELKTVCIRDSQSILVTTRGGNTGIVKVQTSSDQNTLGSLPASPVITISPQFKAFLVSKTPALSSTAPSHTSTSSISFAGLGAQTVGTTATLSQSHSTSAGSMVATDIGQAQQTTTASSHLQASLVKSTVIVPSLSGSGIPTQVPTQAQLVNKPGVKRARRDERSQITKFIVLQSISSFSMISQAGSPTSTSTAVPLPGGCNTRKDVGLTRGILSSNPSAQITTTAQSSPAQTTTPTQVHQSPNFQSSTGTEPAPVISSSHLTATNTRTPASLVKPASVAGTTNPLSTTTSSCTGTVQQRIVINTTTPLAAGTQILLNNTRFVVPPQGLGPGSHVLIISSPAPQVPSTSATTTTAAALPHQGADFSIKFCNTFQCHYILFQKIFIGILLIGTTCSTLSVSFNNTTVCVQIL